MFPIHAFLPKICTHLNFQTFFNTPVLFNTPLVRTLSLNPRPHHQSRSRRRLEDAKSGRLKMRMHHGRLHGQMRKKSKNHKKGSVMKDARFWTEVLQYFESKTKTPGRRTAQENGAGDEDYFNRELLDYEVEHEMQFTLRHCWEILKESGDAGINLNVDVGDIEEYENECAIGMKKEERSSYMYSFLVHYCLTQVNYLSTRLLSHYPCKYNFGTIEIHALERHLEEIHVTWALFWKTRDKSTTLHNEGLKSCLQKVETASRLLATLSG
uniref:Uncharacterized protein n=1 Tax=Tanacetum cinerariifolium TaxID=118510 RepID=A0A6L2JDY0_TANCI|nr:hypothetical protein [Tanacetum cinerariifolium]